MLINDHHMHPTVYARKVNLAFKAGMQEIELKARIDTFLCELTDALKQSGCELIGHIKGLIVADGKGHLMFSLTSFEEATRFQGKLHAGIFTGLLTVNIIVYGVELNIVETVFQKTFHKYFGQALYRQESNDT